MPLINLKTDLRSLRYGNDKPGGGSSGQPYIQKSIPSPEDSPSNIFNTSGPDSLLRGGLLAPIKGVNDVSRLSQMFFDFKSPSGPLFIAKQNLLSRTSVKTEASKGIGYGGGGVNQGVYLPTSTIAQAGVGFTGTHLNLLGIDPTSPMSGVVEGGTPSPLGLNSYFNIVKNQATEDNRLVGLFDAISSNETVSNFAFQKGVNLNTNGGTVLLEYGGGPGSILGIGKTRIPFADQRTGKNNPLTISNPDYFNGKSTSKVSTPIQDFRVPLLDGKNESTIMSLAPDYRVKNIEKRLSLGDPGRSNTADGGKNVLRYSVDQPALDKINARPFYSAAGPDHSQTNDGNDLVKFSIGILQNNGTGVSNYIHFRAFLEGFSDNYSANWSDTQYVGRGEKFYNYGGFNREISMGWTVYAQSKAELIPMYKKLNYLASSLAPDYSSGGFMRGSLARLTVGGYLYNQLGIIKGLTYTIPDESTWEIGIDEEGKYDNSVKELAHMIKVSGFTFIPIQDNVPQKGKSKFIALSNGTNTNWDSGFGMPVDNPRTPKEVEDKEEALKNIPPPPPPPPTQNDPQTEPIFGTSVPVSI